MPKKTEAPLELDVLFAELKAQAGSVAEDLASHIEEVRVLGYVRYTGIVVLMIGVMWAVLQVMVTSDPTFRVFGLLAALIFSALGGGLIFMGFQFSANYEYLERKYSKILELAKSRAS
ncbi:MAG: hypothetical protein QMD00_04690 [Hadesarchaea archaeon]|nr:hypothetical protein [Hadesarchaea archaeon]